MTVIYDDPADFAEDQLNGFTALYADRLTQVPGGVVGHRDTATAKVAVVVGGGSGHYPAFAGLVGPGFAAGAVVGNIFTSPSAAHVYSVAKAADQGAGVILTFGNYAGDVMNFGIAAKRLNAEGIDTRIVLVTDDVASASDEQLRRGIAGDFSVFKVMGAAAHAGLSIDEVERLGRLANERTRTLGVAFGGCTMPGASAPLFEVPRGAMSIGLGIHGEPGIKDVDRVSASELAQVLVDGLLADAPGQPGARVAPILNGLGTTKYEELFLLWGHVARLLTHHGYTVVDPEVGELVTSLDMGGCSLTLMWLNPELEPLWTASAYTPAYRKDTIQVTGLTPARGSLDADADTISVAATHEAQALGAQARQAFEAVKALLTDHEAELGAIDAVAGDGDHGRGMLRGITAACDALADSEGLGIASVLRRAGRSWAMNAGGTSGVLWGAGLEAAADTLSDETVTLSTHDAVRVVGAFVSAIRELGGADIGDKTILDSAIPFAEALSGGVSGGVSGGLLDQWGAAAQVAHTAAQNTAALTPKKGRARPLAEKSVGTPDAGATSFALIVGCLASHASLNSKEVAV